MQQRGHTRGEQRQTLDDCPSEAEAHRSEHVQRRVQYERLVGALLYAAMCTRPDIAHAVNQLSRFLKAPGEAHWRAAKLVLRYLSGTRALCLVYQPSAPAAKDSQGQGQTDVRRECALVVWADADWAGCVDDRKSTTGHLMQLHGCTVSWLSKKQTTVALSSTEAEYMALAMALRRPSGDAPCCARSEAESTTRWPRPHLSQSRSRAATRQARRVHEVNLLQWWSCAATTSRPWPW